MKATILKFYFSSFHSTLTCKVKYRCYSLFYVVETFDNPLFLQEIARASNFFQSRVLAVDSLIRMRFLLLFRGDEIR